MSALTWSSTRSKALAGVVALAATGVVTSLVLTGPAAAEGGDERPPLGWPTHILADDADLTPRVAAQGGGDGETIRLNTRQVRGRFVDVNNNGTFNTGDYLVFRERLRQGGEKVGRDAVECMFLPRAVSCEGTLRLNGRGGIEVAGTGFLNSQRFVLAVVGGTGAFDDASGRLTVGRRLVVELN